MKLKTEPGEDFRAPYLRRLGFEDRIAGKPEGKSLFLYEMGEPTIGPFLRQHYFDSYHNAEEAQKKLAKAVSNLPKIDTRGPYSAEEAKKYKLKIAFKMSIKEMGKLSETIKLVSGHYHPLNLYRIETAMDTIPYDFEKVFLKL